MRLFRRYICLKCHHILELPFQDRPGVCPSCGNTCMGEDGNYVKAFKILFEEESREVPTDRRYARCAYYGICELVEKGSRLCGRNKGLVLGINSKMVDATCLTRMKQRWLQGKDYIGLVREDQVRRKVKQM